MRSPQEFTSSMAPRELESPQVSLPRNDDSCLPEPENKGKNAAAPPRKQEAVGPGKARVLGATALCLALPAPPVRFTTYLCLYKIIAGVHTCNPSTWG